MCWKHPATRRSFSRAAQVAANELGDDRYAANVTGNLALHGITRQETISAQVSVTGDVLRAYGEFTLAPERLRYQARFCCRRHAESEG